MTSQKIRIGNDIAIRWTLLDSDGQPYILTNRDVSIELNVGPKKVRIKEFEIEENILIFTYYGMSQKYTGSYILKFIENDGEKEMVTFDIKDAFTLVEHSWQAIDDGETPDTVQLEFVTITSNLIERVGPKGDRGYSAYEIAVQHGYEGTEEEWLAEMAPKVFLASDETTYAEVQEAIAAGKAVFYIKSGLLYPHSDTGSDFFAFTRLRNNVETTYRLATNGWSVNNQYTLEASSENKVQSLSGFEADTNKYPSTRAVSEALDLKVDKIAGKGLSTEDYTTEEKTKLAGVEAGAERDAIRSITVNGDETDIDENRNLDIFVPERLDQLEADQSHRTVSDTEKAAWNGKYTKPSSGIPKGDLADGVQTSLGKADTAIQDLTPITNLIPPQATEQNQLADKDFVNSSVATNTATFRGTFTSIEDLPSAGVDENDYAFVVGIDASGNTVYRRFKYTNGQWVFEYELNNSSFTASQWAAIQSGITSALVSKLSDLPDDETLDGLFNQLDEKITDLEDSIADALTSDSIVQTTGQSTTEVMSQKAVTDVLGTKADADNVYTKTQADALLNGKEPTIDVDIISAFPLIEDITLDGDPVPFLGVEYFDVYKSSHDDGAFSLLVSWLPSGYTMGINVDVEDVWSDVSTIDKGNGLTEIVFGGFEDVWEASYSITISISYDVGGYERTYTVELVANMVDDLG